MTPKNNSPKARDYKIPNEEKFEQLFVKFAGKIESDRNKEVSTNNDCLLMIMASEQFELLTKPKII